MHKAIFFLILLFSITFAHYANSKDFGSYRISYIDSTTFYEYYYIIIHNIDTLECEKILALPKFRTVDNNIEDYIKLSIGLRLDLTLYQKDSVQANRYSLKTLGAGYEIRSDVADSLMPLFWDNPPCFQTISENGFFTKNIYFCNDIYGLYIKKEYCLDYQPPRFIKTKND